MSWFVICILCLSAVDGMLVFIVLSIGGFFVFSHMNGYIGVSASILFYYHR